METLPEILARASRLLQDLPEESAQVAQEAKRLSEQAQDIRSMALAGRLEGRALRLLGRHEEAIRSLRYASENAQHPLLANQTLIGCIDSLCMIGQEEEALLLSRLLQEKFDELASPIDSAKVWVNMGNIYYRRDEYQQAYSCFEKALPIFEDIGDTLSLGRVQANIANILSLQNHVDEALERFAQARQAFLSHGVAPYIAMLDSNVGFLRYISGEHNAALRLMTQAKQEFIHRNMEVETAKCEADMADVYRDLCLYPEALECYQRAISLFTRLSLSYELARAEHGLAETLFATERREEAFNALARAERGFSQQKNQIQLAGLLITRAQFLRAIGENEEALATALRAEAALKRNNLQGWAGEATLLIHEIALEHDDDAVRAMQSVARVALKHHRRWLASRAENALGNHFARNRTPKRAIKHFRAAVKILEEARSLLPSEEIHSAYLRGKLSVYEDLIQTLLERGGEQDVVEALEWVEQSKSRLLLERIQSHGEAKTAQRTGDAQIERLRAELSRAYFRLHTLDDSRAAPLVSADSPTLESVSAIEKAYRSKLRERDLNADATSPLKGLGRSEILIKTQNALAPDETLVEYFSIRGSLCAFIITPDSITVKRDFARFDEIEYLARRLRYHLQRCELMGATRSGELSTRSILQSLYVAIFQPLASEVTSQKLVIIPQGALHGLPFNAYFDGEKHLIDKYEILYAPSAAIWLETQKRPATPVCEQKQILLMGVLSEGIEQVQLEIEEMSRLLPHARTLIGEEATTQAFMQEAESSRWIHIATHALFRADNPLFSGLHFSDGWLMAHDLYDMRLSCELATLSACRTGVSCVEPGDELFGLVRGFLMAGARSLGVSLWSADDQSTAQTMVSFYKRLLAGEPRVQALRATQQSIRDSFSHPYHWANFVIMGARS